MRLLSKLSGYSRSKLRRIIYHWLKQIPEEEIDYPGVRYMVYDATNFHKDVCLMNLMDGVSHKIIAHTYVRKESFREAYSWFMSLKLKGLNPAFITTDGEKNILRAMRLTWPEATLQRCLYHIQHEGMRWLRSYPKTTAGRELRDFLASLSGIRTKRQRDIFIERYQDWVKTYKGFVLSLPRTELAARDLKRTMALLNHAFGDMFYYLDDPAIHATTNALEGFHSRLKGDYLRHRGLSKEHRIQYINWYCYYENGGS